MKQTDTLSIYDQTASDYERTIADWDDPALREFIDAIPPAGHVLDLGCGPGHAAEEMVARGLRVDAVDGSEEMVRRANRRHGVTARRLLFEELDGKDIYDGIWASFSLLHAPKADFPSHLSRLHRAARTGARLHLGMKLGSGEVEDELGRFYAYYDQNELETLVTAAGFSVAARATGRSKGMAGKLEDWIMITAYA